LLCCALTAFANNYPSFTPQELSLIETKYTLISINRITDFQNNIEVFRSLPKDLQLSKVNLYLNQLLPQYDTIIQQQEDYWATPKEFLSTGYGDCEDYVIIKYFTLLELGFDEKDLFITVVKEKFSGGIHMVLSYFQTQSETPLILDNLSFRILPLEKREDLVADMFINSSGVYRYQNKKLVKVASKYPKYQELLIKIKQGF